MMRVKMKQCWIFGMMLAFILNLGSCSLNDPFEEQLLEVEDGEKKVIQMTLNGGLNGFTRAGETEWADKSTIYLAMKGAGGTTVNGTAVSSQSTNSWTLRSEERRVGTECTPWCRTRWSPSH